VELQAHLAGVMPQARRRGGQAQMGTNGDNKNIISL